MASRTLLLAVALMSLAVPKVQAAGRWDYAFNGGWMRVLIDVDQATNTITSKAYEAQPGGDSIIAANLKLVNAGDRYILYGPITQGKFQIGVGNLTFTVGDMYFLTVFKNGVDASLQLVNATDVWSTHLTWF